VEEDFQVFQSGPGIKKGSASKESRLNYWLISAYFCGGFMQIKLTVTAGPHKGKKFTFGGHDTFLVGRSKHAHFRLSVKDRYFSRIHFMVEVNPPRCWLLDMGSRNGTHVNGRRVSKARLKPGDQIKAGRTTLRVSIMRQTKVPVLMGQIAGRGLAI
jgi:serine/threonine-protein kinase